MGRFGVGNAKSLQLKICAAKKEETNYGPPTARAVPLEVQQLGGC